MRTRTQARTLLRHPTHPHTSFPPLLISGSSADTQGPSAPKQQLDNVRHKAREIEQRDQEHLDDVEKKAFGE